MRVDIGFPLTLEHIHSASPADLITALRSWIAWDNPTCLMHPHGFLVVLLQRSDKQDWRFHFWPKGPRKLTGMPAMIHTHDKIIESRIIKAALQTSSMK